NQCDTAISIEKNGNGNFVNASIIEGNTIEGENVTGIDDHGLGTIIGPGNRFEFNQSFDHPAIILEADGEGTMIDRQYFSIAGTPTSPRIQDNGMPYWTMVNSFGALATGQAIGTSSEPAIQLLPDATAEVWSDSSHLRGWTFVKNGALMNWDNTIS